MPLTARDVMTEDLVRLEPSTPILQATRAMADGDHDCACVLEGESLLGVLTTMDLVFREKRVRVPTVITFMDAVFTLDRSRSEAELRKITGATVGEVMSRTPVTITPDTTLTDLATLMVERHLALLPVLEDGRLIGAVTRRSITRALARRGDKGAVR